MRQFGRKLKLTLRSATESVEITRLRVTFDIRKTLGSEPNSAVIRVYNLNASHRNLLTSRLFTNVMLAVGYEEAIPVFTGDIVEVKTIRDSLDLITEITGGDGYQAFTGAMVNKTLKAGASDTEILAEAIRAMNIDKGCIDLPRDRLLPPMSG